MRTSVYKTVFFCLLSWSTCFCQTSVPSTQGVGTQGDQIHKSGSVKTGQDCTFDLISLSVALLLNIIAGVITAFLIDKSHRRRDRRIKTIYGNSPEYYFVYGQETLRGNVKEAIEKVSKIENWSQLKKEQLIRYPLSKPDGSGEFSADAVACVCEVRGATYIAPSLVKNGRITVKVLSDFDPNIRSQAGLNIISFGMLNNSQTLLLLKDSNSLVEFNKARWRFARKGSVDKVLHPASDGDHDYGIIVRIRPEHNDGVVWIACAGIQETGTSGAAYFLAHRWQELAEKINSEDGFFVAVIKFLQGKDDSGKLVAFAQTDAELQAKVEVDFDGEPGVDPRRGTP
jgi:hypothetical protein